MNSFPTRAALAFTSFLALHGTLFAADSAKTLPSVNARDERIRGIATQGPLDQSKTPEDQKITEAIRKAVVKDELLTATAKNVQILTSGGLVTLRGPVNSAQEKMIIGKFAQDAAGDTKVENQLQVKSTSPK